MFIGIVSKQPRGHNPKGGKPEIWVDVTMSRAELDAYYKTREGKFARQLARQIAARAKMGKSPKAQIEKMVVFTQLVELRRRGESPSSIVTNFDRLGIAEKHYIRMALKMHGFELKFETLKGEEKLDLDDPDYKKKLAGLKLRPEDKIKVLRILRRVFAELDTIK